MEYLVKISKKARILKLKQRNMKKLILTSYTPYPSRKIWCIYACTSLKTMKEQDHYALGYRKPINLLAEFAAVRDVLSTSGSSLQKQCVGIGRIQLEVEEDHDMI
nr:hypothetical protein [Tanacetum cinerariifolium]